MEEDNAFVLADGRTLGWGDYGDPTGTPVVWMHGTPGSRLVGRGTDVWGREAGCRLICPERPGYGLSSPHPGPTHADHARDIADLCTSLGYERYGVIGVSGGSPYVLACAGAAPDRVTRGVIVSGTYGIEPPVDIDELDPGMADNYRRIREGPDSARPNYDATLAMMKTADIEALWPQAIAGAPTWVHERVAANPAFKEAYLVHLIEGFAQGSDAAVQEMSLFVAPWPVAPEAISCELKLWHGAKDPLTPRSHLEAWVDFLKPHASIEWDEECGHLDLCVRFPEILDWVKGGR